MILQPPTLTPFPYPTLFRSLRTRLDDVRRAYAEYYAESEAVAHSSVVAARQQARRARPSQPPDQEADGRSEEHTSELQSRRDLVCRLLLEKKKKRRTRLQSC